MALGIRTAYAIGWKWHNPGTYLTDTGFYRTEAFSIATGRWFPSGMGFNTADHPPLFSIILSITDLLRLETYGEQLLFVGLIGTLVVFVVGMAGRQIAGERIGLIAAAIGSVYPGFWLQGSQVMAEPLSMLIIGILIYQTFTFIRNPSRVRAAILGVLCGLGILTRSELLLLVPLVVWPTVLLLKGLDLRKKITLALIATIAAVVVISPWVIRNAARYHDGLILSTQAGITLAWANCPRTYYGALIGTWQWECTPLPQTQNAAVANNDLQNQAEDYAFAHISRWPEVIWAREGRTWGFYKPSQQAILNSRADRWDLSAAQWETYSLYIIMALALLGGIVLRQSKVPLAPLTGVILLVIITVGIFYGEPRFRSSSEVSLVLLASIGTSELVRVGRNNLIKFFKPFKRNPSIA